ncbi:hypothetical protein F4780DRAFT_785883 [Xylariomycetidae sp. FL0641]|nr:hypothetical protein F4780DRAFT_785883 [Xylariomycetidae sp. FL0641]
MDSSAAAPQQQRKIELQSPEDLAYLLANVRRAGQARLDEAFPPVAQGETGGPDDELRTRIEELVNDYITQTFSLAAPNLSINGLPVDPSHLDGTAGGSQDPTQPDEVFAPFDARKKARFEELAREEEDLLRDLARLKRGVPGAAARAWADAARRGVRADEDALAAALARARASLHDGLLSGAGPLERQPDVEDAHAAAVRGLGRLKAEMPAVVARMERARRAGEYVVTER